MPRKIQYTSTSLITVLYVVTDINALRFLAGGLRQRCRARPKCSTCLLYKSADTASWLFWADCGGLCLWPGQMKYSRLERIRDSLPCNLMGAGSLCSVSNVFLHAPPRRLDVIRPGLQDAGARKRRPIPAHEPDPGRCPASGAWRQQQGFGHEAAEQSQSSKKHIDSVGMCTYSLPSKRGLWLNVGLLLGKRRRRICRDIPFGWMINSHPQSVHLVIRLGQWLYIFTLARFQFLIGSDEETWRAWPTDCHNQSSNYMSRYNFRCNLSHQDKVRHLFSHHWQFGLLSRRIDELWMKCYLAFSNKEDLLYVLMSTCQSPWSK